MKSKKPTTAREIIAAEDKEKLDQDELLHGEVLAYQAILSMLAHIMTLIERLKHVQSLLVKQEAHNPDHFMNKYHKLMLFMINEFKSMMDADPKWRKMKEEGDRARFAQDMGFPAQ